VAGQGTVPAAAARTPPHGIGTRGGAWSRAADLGLFSLGLPEDVGGADCPVVEEALGARALGRHFAPVSVLGSVLGARLAHDAGEPELRDALAEGRERVAVALPRFPGGGTVDVVGLPGAGWVLSVAGDVVTLSRVDPDGAADRHSLDRSSSLHRLPAGQLTDAVAARRGDALVLGRLLAAAMLVGQAEAARDAAVGHAKTREQFGRPIGVHQAIEHACADMAVRCEAASSLLFLAALAQRDKRTDAVFQVSAAKRTAARAALDNARADVQIHGGMGVTWENDAHLFLTRAHVLDQLFGSRHAVRADMLAHAPAMP
jgi:alkylation response protein AidB-like acyl-CoA dehydrogenase